jgi:hypothetical protein
VEVVDMAKGILISTHILINRTSTELPLIHDRCCFIHTTVPGGAQSAPPPDNLAAMMNGAKANSDNVPETVSRLSQRMSSLPISKGFGPNLANYLADSPPRPELPHQVSSDTIRDEPSREGAKSIFGIPLTRSSDSSASIVNERTSKGLGLAGMSLAAGLGLVSNRITNNASEVPPQFQEPPQSLLQRLSAQQSRLDAPFTAYHSSLSLSYTASYSPARLTGSTTMPTSTPLSRHASNGSYSATTSISSNSSSNSSFLHRISSDGSLSSVGGSAIVPNRDDADLTTTKLSISSSISSNGSAMTMQPLQLVGNGWLGSAGRSNGQYSSSTNNSTPASAALASTSSALDWSNEQLDEYGEDFYLGQGQQPQKSQLQNPFFTSNYNHQDGSFGSVCVDDRSSERAPLGPHRSFGN